MQDVCLDWVIEVDVKLRVPAYAGTTEVFASSTVIPAQAGIQNVEANLAVRTASILTALELIAQLRWQVANGQGALLFVVVDV